MGTAALTLLGLGIVAGCGRIGYEQQSDRPPDGGVGTDGSAGDAGDASASCESPLSGIAQIAVGGAHACALGGEARLRCWGNNHVGQLGVGDDLVRFAPATVGMEWLSVAAGAGHTCGLARDGGLWCWGGNAEGQLGRDTISQPVLAPVRVGTDVDWTRVSAGGNVTCAVKADGRLFCMGRGNEGATGLGVFDDVKVPTRVGGDSDWADVAVGDAHTCALRVDGRLFCWGDNTRGQVGVGLGTAELTTPVQVGTDADWATVAPGFVHTCAIKIDGRLFCWGLDDDGQLGVGGGTLRDRPVQVGTDSDWAEVTAGARHTCARKLDRSAWCWGSNALGALGVPTVTAAAVPTRMGSDGDWEALHARKGYTCGVRDGGTVWCWGDNTLGQLATSEPTRPLSPTRVGSDADWGQISAAGHICAIRGDGSVWCWGTDRRDPFRVDAASDWTEVRPGGQYYTCGRREPGTLWCWGGNNFGQLGQGDRGDETDREAPTRVGSATDYTLVSAGGGHACAVRSDGGAWCWGRNHVAQLGLGAASDFEGPSLLALTGWIGLGAGTEYTCGIRSDETLYCWGVNDEGQLGLGDRDPRSTPTLVASGFRTVAANTAFGRHSCGLRTDGTLWCWGANVHGQLGLTHRTTETSPRQVGADADWQEVGVNASHSCAIRADGSLWCWGKNDLGQLGLGDTVGRAAPEQVGLGWASVAVGETQTSGVKEDGTLWRWGAGVSDLSRRTPTEVCP